ncbi:hypothetical protein SDC9_18365 [bioreactor metagenome]|uniref:Uncharacterized protein n=1 Tax=bioreactor metagenome TaxID=1076179 RepID=A0A644U0B6_9ZZZZ
MNAEEVQGLASSVSAEVIAARGRMVVLGAKNRGKVTETGPSRRTPPKNLSARDKIKSSFMGKK